MSNTIEVPSDLLPYLHEAALLLGDALTHASGDDEVHEAMVARSSGRPGARR